MERQELETSVDNSRRFSAKGRKKVGGSQKCGLRVFFLNDGGLVSHV